MKIMNYKKSYHLGEIWRCRLANKMMKFKFDDIVLDSGCGSGYTSYNISKKVSSVTAVDISEELINSLNCLKPTSNLNFMQMDANHLSEVYKAETFDKIICLDILEHVQTPDIIIKNFSEILKLNGTVLITIPLGNHGHFNLSKNQLIDVFKNNNFNIETYKQIKQPFMTNLIQKYIFKARAVLKISPKEVDRFDETILFQIEKNPTMIYKVYKKLFYVLIFITKFDKAYRENGNISLIICRKMDNLTHKSSI